MSADLKDHFLHIPMDLPEYMKVPYSHFPQEIKDQYNLQDKVTSDGFIYIRINKDMYGLKQAAIMAYQHIKRNLEPHGYYPVVGTTGMWKHETRKIYFCLCVDDFRIKYYNKEDVEHLLDKIGKNLQLHN